ncbi:MAG: trigger factor [Candidatus Limivicinus sp.]|jgi:trigger factor
MYLKSIDKNETNKATFTVASDAAEFEKAVQQAYLKNKKDVYIPGFRKGKAPRQVIEGMYGREVFYQDAMDEIAPDAYAFGVKEGELRVVGQPRITDVKVTDDRCVEFSFDVSLVPVPVLGQYKGIEAYKKQETVSDEAVDAEIKAVQKRNARMLNVDRAAETGDTVDIDFDGYLNGEPFEGGSAKGHSLELGSNSFVPGFEEQLVGMKAGEEKDIDITFPENYTEELAGKAVVFHVKVNEVSAPEYPELDDEFAKDVSEFDTFEEYKADVRSGLQKKMDDEAEKAFKDLVVRKACDAMEVEIPAVMVEEKIDEFLYNYASQFGMNAGDMSREELMKLFGMNEDAVNYMIRPSAEMQVKTELMLEAVAKAENLEPSEEDMNAYWEKVAKNVGATVEDAKRYLSEAFVKEELKRDMAMDLLVANAVATDKPEEPKAEEAAEEGEKKAEEKPKAKRTRKPKAAKTEEAKAPAADEEKAE